MGVLAGGKGDQLVAGLSGHARVVKTVALGLGNKGLKFFVRFRIHEQMVLEIAAGCSLDGKHRQDH